MNSLETERFHVPPLRGEQITVRVSNKILYIGTTLAYPLNGVVRVQCAPLAMDRGRAARSILLNLTVFLILFKFLGALSVYFSGFAESAGLALFAVLVILAVRSWGPAAVLWASRNSYHMLSVSSSGNAYTRLTSLDAESLQRTARMIIDAIDDPAAGWQVQVVNHHIGDIIQQSGAASIGKVAT